MMKGYFKLTADVRNPKPDRRRKRSMDCAEVWKAGTVVWINDTRAAAFQKAEELAGERLQEHPTDSEPRGFIRFTDHTQVMFNLSMKAILTLEQPEHVQGNGVVNAVEPAPQTLGQILKAAYWTAEDLLAILIDTGKITLQDVDAVKEYDLAPELKTDSPEWDAANDAFRKRHGI